MKIRTWKYMVKEGFSNTYRNKLMSIASVSIVTASLIIFGIFLLITFNLSYNLDSLTRQPELEVFCRPELDDAQVGQVEESIKENDKIAEYKIVTKEEALEKAKKIMGENAQLLEGEDASFLNVSFIIKVKDVSFYQEVVEEYKKLNEVENVQYYMDIINLIKKVDHWVRIVNWIILAILLVVSVFIISNTIKLTVFARRKEISIMKYIGATDWFIRWPFIVEGIIIGIVGAVLSFVLIGYGYSSLGNKLTSDFLTVGNDTFKILKINDIGWKIICIYLALGAAVGALGSTVSIRKYLKV